MMKMMKNPFVLAACVVLFLALAIQASENSFGPDECCFQFVSRSLPKRRVVDYKHTDERCSNKAVLFKMAKGAQICADPTLPWVNEIISYVQNKTINSHVTKSPN